MATSTLLSVLLSVGVLVALVTCGDSDKGCCMPRQFKARAPITIDIGYRSSYAIADVALDFEAKKSLVFQIIYKNGKPYRNITVIQDYKLNKRYVIINEKRCIISEFHKHMKNECFLKKAIFQEESYFGANSDKLEFKKFVILKTKRNNHGRKIKIEHQIMVTKDECVPIRQKWIKKKHFYRETKRISYFEIKTEVESELFDVPEICETPPASVSNVKSSSLESEYAFQGELGDAEIPEASAIALNFANV